MATKTSWWSRWPKVTRLADDRRAAEFWANSRRSERLASQTHYAIAPRRSVRSTIRSCASRRLYKDAAREALIVIWEASDRICGKRLRPLVPILVEAMERHGHLQLAAEVRTDLLSMSAATIDRALREVQTQAADVNGGTRRHRRRSGVALRYEPSTTGITWL
jgi:hypothetical protein